MAESARKKIVYEGAAARYRALMVKTRDPARRRMLEEMIAREVETAKRRAFTMAAINGRRLEGGDAGTA